MIEELIEHINAQQWPTALAITGDSRASFEAAMDMVRNYRGKPETLYAALDAFKAIESLPMAAVGVAETLIAGAFLRGTEYQRRGLAEAATWVAKARAAASDSHEVRVADLHLALAQSSHPYKVRTSEETEERLRGLMRALADDPESFGSAITRLLVTARFEGAEAIEHQYRKALALARNETQTAFAHRTASSVYLLQMATLDALSKALGVPAMKHDVNSYAEKADTLFRETQGEAQDDPWFWHNWSLVALSLRHYRDAARFNRQALSLMTFGNALDVQSKLKRMFGPLYRFL